MQTTVSRPTEQDLTVGEIVGHIRCIAASMFADFKRTFADNDLSIQMGKVLLPLNSLRQATVSELAGEVLCDVGNLSGTLDRLEEAGLIERVASDADRRTRLIQLTAKGRRTAAQIESQFRRTAIYKELARMERRERDTLGTLLRRLDRALNRVPYQHGS